MTKMTYAQAIDNAIALFNGVETDIDVMATLERLEDLKGSLAKRSSGKRGMTSTQKANVGIKETILDVLADLDKPSTVSEINHDERLAEYTNQKISALLCQLLKDDKVVKTLEKKKALYSLV